jgi:hypothetical protein
MLDINTHTLRASAHAYNELLKHGNQERSSLREIARHRAKKSLPSQQKQYKSVRLPCQIQCEPLPQHHDQPTTTEWLCVESASALDIPSSAQLAT